MKKLLTLPLLICLILLASYLWWKNMSSPVNLKDTKPRDFIVTKGQTGTQIAKNLQKQGFIKSDLAFRLYSKITGNASIIQAGDYQISPNLSVQQLTLVLEKGPQELWVTIPEGLRREEIIDKVVKTLSLSTDEALTFSQEFLLASQGKEGTLFPDTYLMGKDTSAEKLVTKMTGIFNSKVTSQLIQDAKKNKLSLNQIVTLASIIERETRTDEERPVVAGILLNRIENGMALQVDATLQYASANRRCYDSKGQVKLECNWWTAPTGDDTDIRSTFNTYTHTGLPPAPISNPGFSSLKAAVYPETTDYFFYLHDKNGQIHYAKTGKEHAANVEKYLR